MRLKPPAAAFYRASDDWIELGEHGSVPPGIPVAMGLVKDMTLWILGQHCVSILLAVECSNPSWLKLPALQHSTDAGFWG